MEKTLSVQPTSVLNLVLRAGLRLTGIAHEFGWYGTK